MASSSHAAAASSSHAAAASSSHAAAASSSHAAAASSSHAVAASSSRSCKKYDVFLSFRGEDVRKTFVDHLYSALVDKQIQTYKDDETLSRGESIGPSLFKAIEESKLALITFSKHYANSSWCLDELAHIMKCREERELTVMPIFYDVDPSDVRKQKGDFGKAYAQLEVEHINKAQSWRNALVDASNIAGWEPKYIANGHEAKVIKEIVDTVLDRLYPLNTDIDEYLVGMTTRLKDLKSQLEIGSKGVCMVGIWGVGGSGKTTLATYLYMEIRHHFQGHCLMENVREESSKFDLKKVQENLLSAIFKREVTVSSVVEGKHVIKNMLCSKNVLIILDDVNNLDQLDALAGSHSWFGNGSRIIITTRDEHLLRTHKVDEVCHARLLSEDEGIQLFNRHAYNEKDPVEDYETLSLRVVSYAAGLPLALKVLGKFLYDKGRNLWMSTLARLKDIPEQKIMEKLKISYDGLETVDKELFLDIACFWRWKKKSDAKEVLEACGYHPEIGIEVLRQKALITVSRYGRFDMHDLVQEMGHYIVRGDHPNNLDQHSRLWNQKEIDNMHFGDATMENDKIEAIEYIDGEYGHDISQLCKVVSNAKQLRYLSVRTSNPMNVKGPTFLSSKLCYLDWIGYRTRSPFPDGFQAVKLVVLKLRYSFQKELWKGCKRLPHLKILELDSMKKLLRMPNFDELPCLQNLTLSRCYKLKEIHPSLGNHTNLQYVSVSLCTKLRMFPTIVHMENLKNLHIESCPNILEFPKIQANMEGLLKLSIDRTSINVLPSSIGERCPNLISIKLSNFKNLKSIQFNFDALKNLKELRLLGLIGPVKTRRQLFHQFLLSLCKLDLYACCFNNVEIPSSIIGLSNLQELDLSWNGFSRLDFSLSQFTQVKLLDVSHCENLLELPELPSSLTTLNAGRCPSLTTFGDCHKNCKRLCKVSLWGGGMINDGDRLLESMIEVCIANENHYMLLQLTGVEIAKGFTPPLLRGNECTLQLPDNWCNDYSGFLICAVMTCFPNAWISMNGEMNGMDLEKCLFWEENDIDRYCKCSWMIFVSFDSLRQTAWWDQTYKALEFDIHRFSECSGFGVRLIEKKSRNGLTKSSANSISSSSSRSERWIEHDSMSPSIINFKFSFP